MYLFITINNHQIKFPTIAYQFASECGKKLHRSMSQKYSMKYFYGMLQWNDSTE